MGWKSVHRMAFDLALDGTDVAEAAEALLAAGERDRREFDLARLHYLGQVDDHDDDELRNALAYVEEALRRGDLSGEWIVWGHADAWDIGHSHLRRLRLRECA